MSEFYTYVTSTKNDILIRGYKNGKRITKKIPYKPYLFVPTTNESRYTTIEGERVGRIDFDSIKEAREFSNTYKDVEGMTVYGMTNFVYPCIYDTYPGEIDYDPALISVVGIDIEVDIATAAVKGFPDVQLADNEITLITLAKNGKRATFGCQPFENDDPNVTYYLCKDEVHLLLKLIDVWNSDEWSPDVVTGWNIETFDIPYIINRIAKLLGLETARKLSPWKMLHENTIEVMGKSVQMWNIVGVTTLDYLQLYKKFAYTIQESYSLDFIAMQELGERKLDYGEYGSLARLQIENWQLYCKYNIRDADLVERLEDKLKLIELVYAIAYGAKINFQDTFTTVRPWDVIIHNYLMDKGMVVPPVSTPDRDRGILGGYVKDPQVGLHDWVVSLDLNSLYPHIIMQYNISPETFNGWLDGNTPCLQKEWAEQRALQVIDGHLNDVRLRQLIEDSNITVAANWTTFKRDKLGFIPALMSKYYNERTVYKGKMIEAKKKLESLTTGTVEYTNTVKDIAKFNNFQMAYKILLNSCYGALSNQFFRWFRNEFAEAITASGQLTTRWIEIKLNEFLNKTFKTVDVDYVIACDTDSVYIKAGKFVNLTGKDMTIEETVKYLDNVCVKVLEPYIDKMYDRLCDIVNGYEQKMRMKRECIANKGIWTAKKRYILNVWNNEGVQYEKAKLKMMGIEAIRTSTPMVCRDAIKETLGIIMNDTEEKMQSYVEDFRIRFNTLPFEQVASPRSVSNLDKYKDAASIFVKGTPINAKAALIYNYHLKDKSLDRKYEAIEPGQKIKYAYCKMPNPLRATVIASPGALPEEFNMDPYIDRERQWDASYASPIKTIVGAIGWDIQKRATLDSFFM